MRGVVVAAVLLAFGAGTVGCVSAPGSDPSGAESAAAVVETQSPDEADAIRFRTSFGLRSDIGHIRAVAGDPRASSSEFGVPLLPDELAELEARTANAEKVKRLVNKYTDEHPSEFGGLYLDHQNGGAVTTLWTAHLDEHSAAILRFVGPTARVAFRAVRFTYRDLRALQDRITADFDWLRTKAIAPVSAGVDVIANTVELSVSSADPAASVTILAHYGVPDGMLVVHSDGTGAAFIRNGTVRGRIIDARGEAPGEAIAMNLNLAWTSDGPGDCGYLDVGFGVAADGTFELPCKAGGHSIIVEIGLLDRGWLTIGSGHVFVVADAIVELEIRLDQPWSEVGGPAASG